MLDFERWFFPKACLVKGAFGTLQFLPNESLGEPGRLIGEGRCGWCPTGGNGISWGQQLLFIQIAKVNMS